MSELDERVITFLQDVTGAMGLSLDVATEETPDHVRLNLTGDDADVFLRRNGEPLDALQVIVNTAFRRDERGDRHYVVDAVGFRKDQDEALRKKARTLAEKVQASGESEELGPFNPYARRIVHLAVSENPAVSTESIGEDFMKIVVISVKR
ncbi:MAG: R3H domain-containing nucleic acid-binding protein [Acidobacteriota bacterium]